MALRTRALIELPEAQALRTLTADGRLLFATRMLRMFGYGALSVVLVLYLTQLALDERHVGLLLTATLIGDAAVSLAVTLVADRVGRRLMLAAGAGLMIFAGVIFALTDNLLLLTFAAVIGTLSPSGNEVGPFLSIEQAALPQTTDARYRTPVYAWYHLAGSFATALGALGAGSLAGLLQAAGQTPLESYRVVVATYAVIGVILLWMFTRLSRSVEAPEWRTDAAENPQRKFGLQRSRGVIFKLASLYMVDAFGSGLVLQSLIAYWLNRRFGVEPAVLGGIFFAANLFAAGSALAAGRLAARFGLINTMVWTHMPANILLILVPLMPTLPLAVLLLLARASVSQMDVPTRQSYIMAVVDPNERSAAAGVTTIARTAASAIAPTLTGLLLSVGLLSVPFFLAGALKIVYDLSLYRSFIALKPPEEDKIR
jgi:MFS family permease